MGYLTKETAAKKVRDLGLVEVAETLASVAYGITEWPGPITVQANSPQDAQDIRAILYSHLYHLGRAAKPQFQISRSASTLTITQRLPAPPVVVILPGNDAHPPFNENGRAEQEDT